MSTFSEQFLDDIRARVRVSTLVGRRVRLVQRGHEFVGLSPFTSEKTPSFTVNDAKGFYHCFSSQEHGDIFTFVMKTDNLTFPEAVEALAEEAGVEMPRRTAAETQKAAKAALLLPVVEAACAIFEETLWSDAGAAALSYLRGRGLTDETIKRFRLGYAPPGNTLKARMTARGTAELMLLETRLVSPGKEGRESFDFFRDRVMFPICDIRGRPVAFGGRVMGEGEPKYLNSADTPLFHKGSLLYGLSLAKEAAAAKKEIIGVEGYMDVIVMAQAGFENTVAPLGTALTEGQLALLWRYADDPVLCFDGDRAGIAASLRAAGRALPELLPGKTLRFARLPEGLDPDDLCRGEGPEAMRALLDGAKPLSEVLWDQLVAEIPHNTPERRAGFAVKAAERAKEIKDETVQKAMRAYFRERMAALFKGEGAAPEDEPPGDDDGWAVEPRGAAPRDPYHDGPTPIDILGEDAPIAALGHSMRGLGDRRVNTLHFLDSKGQVQSYSASALRTPTNVLMLTFGDQTWLEAMAPNKTAEGNALPGDRGSWKASVIVPLLMRACDAAGFFDPEKAVRGPGVWPYGEVKEWPRRDPRIVVHTGDKVYVVSTDRRPVKIEDYRGGVRLGEFVYTRTRAEDPLEADALAEGEAMSLIRFYECWMWEEKARALGVSLAGFLTFGWLAAAGIVALLEHRPHIFVRGSSKIGKSALCTFHEELLGSTAIRLENATMTGIRGEFLDPQPVRALICNESNDRTSPQAQEQLRDVLNLALYVYTSGEGRQLRGPGGISGSINAIFMFAAVRPPTLNNDDANRMLLLNMKPLEQMSVQKRADFKTRRAELISLGPRLRRRMIERWGDYLPTFARFEAALIGKNFDTRQADTFGTLMACAWLAWKAKLPTPEEAEELALAVSTSQFLQASEEAEPDWKRCWTHLTTFKVDWFDGRRATIGELIEDGLDHGSAAKEQARKALKAHGLALVKRVSKAEKDAALKDTALPEPYPREWIAVSYGHQGLDEIFKTTDWRNGKWAVLGQMPDAEKNHPANFAGAPRSKAYLIPVAAMRPADGEDNTYADDPLEAARTKEADGIR